MAENPSNIVVYLKPVRMEELPLPVHHMSKIDASFTNRLLLHYMYSANELLNFLSGFHAKGTSPRAIIVDDVDIFMENAHLPNGMMGSSELTAKIIALLMDLAGFFTRKNGNNCLVFTTTTVLRDATLDPLESTMDETGDELHRRLDKGRIPSIIGHFIEDIIKLDIVLSEGHRKRFKLTNPGETLTVMYYLEDGQIFLEQVTSELMQMP